jgi:hypothetical protein
MYGYNPLASEHLAQSRINDARRDGRVARLARSRRRHARRRTRFGSD